MTTKNQEIVSPTVQHFGDDLSFEYLDKNNDMLIPSHEINEIESPYMDPIIYHEQPYMTYKKNSYHEEEKNITKEVGLSRERKMSEAEVKEVESWKSRVEFEAFQEVIIFFL